MRCFKKNLKFLLEGKWTFGIIPYTLSRAKSNGTIHLFFLWNWHSLSIFLRPPKTLYFICNWFSLHHTENLITESSIPWKNTSFLFKPFFSRWIIKYFFIYDSTILSFHKPSPDFVNVFLRNFRLIIIVILLLTLLSCQASDPMYFLNYQPTWPFCIPSSKHLYSF